MLKMEEKFCICCGKLTQKRSRRIISDSTDILSLWEEALKRKLEETRAKKLFKMIDLCAVML